MRSRILVAAATLAVVTLPALAEPAKVMIPANPGGGWDGTGRLTMTTLQSSGIFKDGANFTNKGGAAGTLGLADFIRDKGNDNAIMFMGVIMVGGIITNKSPVTLDQVTPLARLTFEYNALAVPADSPIKSAKDFAEALKKDPGKVSVGGGSVGSVDQIMLALIGKEQGVPAAKLNFVAFSGAEVVTTLAAGKLTAAISGISELKPQADAGRIRLIAVSSEQRVPGVNAPTLKEQGINVVIGNWRGVVGAPAMSDAGRKAWLDRLTKLAATKEWKEALAKQGLEDAYLGGDKFVAFLNDEKKRWAAVLTELGLVK